MKIRRLALAAFVVASMGAGVANAGAFYVAGGLGQSNLDIDKTGIDRDLIAQGATDLQSNATRENLAGRLVGGYQFSPNLAVEGGYVSLGGGKYNSSFTGGNVNGKVSVDGVVLDVLGIATVSPKIAIFIKAGVIHATTKATVTASAPGYESVTSSASESRWRPNLGFGVNYYLNSHFGVRVEMDAYNHLVSENERSTGNANMWTVGATYRF